MTDSTKVPDRRRTAVRPRALAVTRAVRVLVSRTQLYADSVGHGLGLHRSDLMALNLMSQAAANHGELMTPGDVAKQMSLSAAAVTALVDRLERVGHLVRQPDAHDRRRVRLDVSKQAESVSREMFRPMNDRLLGALSAYSDQELELVAQVLRDLSVAVDGAEPVLEAATEPTEAAAEPTGEPE
ncbi:MAG: MarR family transcriptional regulator [Ornithinimicrobium sp.]